MKLGWFGRLHEKAKEDAQRLPARRFRLVRYFTVASLGAFVLVAAALTWHERRQAAFLQQAQQEQGAFFKGVQDAFARRQDEAARRDLLAIHESGNVNLTRLFANSLWERDFAPFVAKASTIPVEHCRAIADVADPSGKRVAPPEKKACYAEAGRKIMAFPEFKSIDAKVYDSMKKSTVFKVKVFDLRGITAYSSEHAQIGEDKALNAGWKSAIGGKPASELTHRGKFSAFEGVVENRDLIASYLPVLAPGSDQIVGVFEVYSDVTPFLAQIKSTSEQIRNAAADNEAKVEQAAERNRDQTAAMSTTSLLAVFMLLAILFAVLFLVVRRAERILVEQEKQHDSAQQQLAQSEKMASLGQMVAGVTHQLNTPLAFSHSNVSLVLQQLASMEQPMRVASKFTEIVKMTPGDQVVLNLARARRQVEACQARPEDVGAMREMLTDVLHGIDQMSELVQHMRNFTRLDRAKVADFNVNRGLRTVAYIARSVIPNRVKVVEEYGELPDIVCNPSQLNQVFLNLINNAAQAIDGIGTITVRSRAAGGRVLVEVEDTGSGIAPEVLPRIFENYFSTKPEGEGTGLGLTVARDIVRSHGGDIEVATELGAGSTFTVWLPAAAQPGLAKAA
jgi:signal transduction histidine kinase